MRRLLCANALLAALIGAHIADHVTRQHGAPTSAAQTIPGLLGAVIVLGSLALTARRDPRAPIVAAVVGVATAAGFLAVHVLPRWSVFSDPYSSRHLDAVSWVSMLVTLGTGLLLSAVALTVRYRRPGDGPRALHARTGASSA